MNIKPSNYVSIVAISLVAPFLFVLGYNLYIDPFQIFHKDIEKPITVLAREGKDRYQNAGIINQYHLNAIIVGHSHSANYLPSKIKNELNINDGYSLTMDGSSINVQSIVCNYALSKSNIEYVLWGVTYNNLRSKPYRRNKKRPFNEYLYDNSRINDLKLFMSFDLHKYHIEKKERRARIINSLNQEELKRREFDRANVWHDSSKPMYNRPIYVAKDIIGKEKFYYSEANLKKLNGQLLESYLNNGLNDDFRYAIKHYKNTSANIKKNIISLLRQYPETRFDFVITAFPTFRTQVLKIRTPNKYIACLAAVKLFVEMVADYPNAKVFGFGLEKFPRDLRLYKDKGHYHIAVNDFIVEAISVESNLLTMDNIDQYLVEFDHIIDQYRLPEKWNPSGFEGKIKVKGATLSNEVAREIINGNVADFVSLGIVN